MPEANAVSFQEADIQDVEILSQLMREFYELEQLPYDQKMTREVLTALFRDRSMGSVWIILYGDEETGNPMPVGYIVVGFGFSLEFHGRDALIDEFYVREPYRGLGIGERALDYVVEFCRAHEIRCLHLEVDWTNGRARNLYLRKGFRDHKRHLMTKWIDSAPGG